MARDAPIAGRAKAPAVKPVAKRGAAKIGQQTAQGAGGGQVSPTRPNGERSLPGKESHRQLSTPVDGAAPSGSSVQQGNAAHGAAVADTTELTNREYFDPWTGKGGALRTYGDLSKPVANVTLVTDHLVPSPFASEYPRPIMLSDRHDDGSDTVRSICKRFNGTWRFCPTVSQERLEFFNTTQVGVEQ